MGHNLNVFIKVRREKQRKKERKKYLWGITNCHTLDAMQIRPKLMAMNLLHASSNQKCKFLIMRELMCLFNLKQLNNRQKLNHI